MLLARYYFHIREGWNLILDEEGMELPTPNAARTEAYASADDLSRTAIQDGLNIQACAIEIADRDGNILGSVKVTPQQRIA